LEKALNKIQTHHDILRLRLIERKEDEWTPRIMSSELSVPLTIYDVNDISEEQKETFIRVKENEGQTNLNIYEGPIWRAVYFKDDIQGDRLFWVIHHLAVDGVSWRILMEDLKNAYLQLQEGGEITLPPKTSSYKDWAYNLKEYAYSSYIQ